MNDSPENTNDAHAALANPQDAEATLQVLAAFVRQVLREDDDVAVPAITTLREMRQAHGRPKRRPEVKVFSARMELDTIAYFTEYGDEHRLSMRDVFIRAAQALKGVSDLDADHSGKTKLQGQSQ